MVAKKAQCAANGEKNTCKLKTQLYQFDSTHAANAHSTKKLRNALQILTHYVFICL